MNHSKWKLALGIGAVFLTVCGAMPVVLAVDAAGDSPSPGDIFDKAKEKYAALTSYSDEGKTVATLKGATITTTFTIRLARPNLYRVDWTQSAESPGSTTTSKPQSVWSAGEGDFLNMGKGAEKQTGQEMALAGATGISGGAAATVPGTFFQMNWGNMLGGPIASEKKQADEKVGDIDCYVLANEMRGQSRTLWIGKDDFLIHQVRTVTSMEAIKAALEKMVKSHPEMAASLKDMGAQDSVATETHTNIVVNPKLSPADFGH